MENVPKKIYLQIDADGETPEDFKDLAFVSWCEDKTHDNDIEYVLKSPVEAAEDVGTAAVNYVTDKHHKQAGENWYEEDEAEKQSFIAGATFGMGLKEKEISALREQLEDQAKIIKELKKKV